MKEGVGRWEDCKSQKSWTFPAKPYFLGMTNHYTHEFTVAWAPCIRSVQDQTSQNTNLVGGGDHEVPPLSKELLGTDCC